MRISLNAKYSFQIVSFNTVSVCTFFVIGLNDREKEHVFSWSSGVPFSGNSFSNWNLNEPNDNAGTENCVEFQAQTGLWNDLRCDRALPFICEHTLGTFDHTCAFDFLVTFDHVCQTLCCECLSVNFCCICKKLSQRLCKIDVRTWYKILIMKETYK